MNDTYTFLAKILNEIEIYNQTKESVDTIEAEDKKYIVPDHYQTKVPVDMIEAEDKKYIVPDHYQTKISIDTIEAED